MATTTGNHQAKGQPPKNTAVDAVHEYSKTTCLQIKLEKVREQYLALCKKWSFLPMTNAQRSFAEVASRSCVPQVFVPITKEVMVAVTTKPKKEPLRHILSKREARQDFAAAGAERNAQRRANNELAAMIEARYAEQRPLLSLPHRISRKAAQASVVAFSRSRQSEKKRNNYLAACIGFRYGVQYDAEEHAPASVPLCSQGGSVERSIRGPCNAKKQVKEIMVEEEDWDDELSKVEGLGKADYPGLRSSFLDEKYSNRRLNLRSVLLATSRGKALLCGIVSRLFELRNIDTSFLSNLGLDQCARPQEAVMPEENVLPQIVPEMDVTPTVTSVKSDTVIDSSTVEVAELQSIHGYYEESSTMLNQVYSTLTDRWLLIANFDWNSNQPFNMKIKTIDLPYSVIKDNPNASNANLFLQHRFFRSDIRVKILLNTNRYQVGALVASVFYYEKSSTGNGQNNVASGIQRLSHTIKAGGSDTCEFLIPYRHINSALSLKDKEEANFCKIEFFVLNQLSVAETSAATCSLTVSICFEDSSFNGLIARATPQMDVVSDVAQLTLNPSISNAVNVASSVLNTCSSDNNRDNPPVPLQPMSFVPQAVGSFCHTDNALEPINVLRADPTGQVPHPDTSDEMSVDQLRRTWGYLKTIRWTTEDKYAAQLDNVSVAPLLPLDQYPLEVPTPLAMLTSMYGYWRGDIEFKFEVVANAFYQGKFMVTCVPLATSNSQPTMDQAKLSANQVYSVDSTEEKIFVCPWNWYNSFARTRREEQVFDSIGLLQVFVYNRLIAIANVSPNIYINVYVRGGKSFEEAIIRPPLLYSSQTDPLIPPQTQSPTPYNTESAWYTTYNSSVKSASGKYPIVPYIQNITNGWVGYSNLKEGYLYRLENKTTKGFMFRCMIATKNKDNKIQNVIARYGTYDPALSTANAHGMIVSDQKSDIVEYIKEYKKTKDVAKARDKIKTVWVQDGAWSQVLKNGVWVTATDPNDPPIWTWDGEAHEDRQLPVVGEMRRAIRLGPPTKPTASGRSVFGEKCPDLKSYCRRYNTFGSMNVKTCTAGLPQDCPYAAVIRVNPIRHIVPNSSRSFDNRYREGPISAIGEMYRFWRGGLRFRFVVAGNPPEGTMMYVCHRFDMVSPSDLPVFSNRENIVISGDDMLHTQYATYSQALSVNQVFTVEVPYYQEKEYLSLLNNADRTITDNGSLQIWVTSSTPANLHIEVYFSFADDTRYSLFQGVGKSKDISAIAPEPEMKVNEDISVTAPKPEMEVNFHSSTNVQPPLSEIYEEPQMDIRGGIKYVKECVGEAAKYFKGKYETLCETGKNLKETLTSFNNVAETIKTVKTKMVSFWDYLMNLSNDMIDLIVSIFYAITAKSFLHATVAIANIVRKCFRSLKQNVISKLFASLTKVSDWVLSLKPTQVVTPEMSVDSEAIGSLGSFVFSAMSSLCSVAVSPPTSFAGLKKGLFDFSQTARSSSSVKTYLMDTVEFIRRCIKTFIVKFSITSDDYKLISGLEDERLKNWLIDASFITSSQNREAVLQKPEWALKAFELQLVGRALMVAVSIDKNSNARLSALVNKVTKDLEDLSVELRNKKVFAGVRYEPCVVWVASPCAGIGKSRYVIHLMERYAKELKIDSVNYYYAMTPGMKHGDGMENMPFIYADDAGSLTIALDQFFYTFMLQGKSSGQYTPAFADLPLKGTKLNFQNVFASSNKMDFSNSPGILCEDAFNRRLDIPVLFEFTPGWNIQRVKNASKEELDRLDQVKAFIYDPVGKKTKYEIKRVPGRSYRDIVDEHILQLLCKYHLKESARYTAACDKVRERLQNASTQAGRTFEEQLEAYRKVVNSITCSESDSTPLKDKYVVPDLEAWLTDFKKAAAFDLKQPVPVYSQEQIQGDQELAQEELPEVYESDSDVDIPEGFFSDDEFLDAVPEMDGLGGPTCWHIYQDLHDMAYMDQFAVDMRTMSRYPKECPRSTACIMRSMSTTSKNLTHKLCYNQYNIEETSKGLQNKPCTIPHSIMERLQMCVAREPHVAAGIVLDILAQEQKKIREQNRIIADVVLPKQKKGWADHIWNAVCAILGLTFRILTASIAILATFAVIQTLSNMFNLEDPPKAQLHPSGDYQTIKSSNSLRTKALRLVQPQMAQRESLKEVQDQFEEKLRIISGNTLFLMGTDPVTGAVYKGRCLGLYDRTVLTVKHYFDHFIHKNIKRLRIVRPNSNTTIFDVDIDDLRTRWGDCGYGILTLPKSYPTQFRKITQFFPTEGLASEYPAKIQMFEDSGAGYKLFSMDMVVVDSVTVPQSGSFDEWTIREGFSYPWGGSGRCGSLVLSPTLASPIIGIHTAGSEGVKGYAERLLRETFEETPSHIEYVEPQLDFQGSVYQLDGSYTEVGKLERDLVPNFPKESAIVPSVISPVFPITTEPAPLSNNDGRLEEECDILKIGASKRCDPMKEFPEELVKIARSHYEDKIIAQVKPLRGNIGMLSYAQAIEGLPCDSTGPIVMSTSEGFPWRSLRPKSEKNKKWLFQLENSVLGVKVKGIERSLYENLNYKHELRKQGKVPASYFTCCLKDARILREKVSIPGKTRIFEMSPIELTIAQRQYFYDYVGAYIASRTEHAIGINPDGPEWSAIANELNDFSSYILTADYSAYGPRVNSALLYEAYGVTTAWYRYHMAQQGRQDEELYKVQQVVAHEVAHGLHVVNNLVFRPSAGLPSGNIETVTKNSQVNSLYVRIAFLGLAADNAPHYKDLYWFEKFVLLYTYGDDLIMAVKEEIIEWFNNQTLIEFFSRYRLKMTDALKSGSTRPFCSLNEATFLKRGFMPHPNRAGQWLAPLERASITDTANWIHKSINPLEASLVNSEMCCRLAYTLGPDDFVTICQTIKEKWRQRGHRFEFPSWHSLDCHVWEGTPGPLFSF